MRRVRLRCPFEAASGPLKAGVAPRWWGLRCRRGENWRRNQLTVGGPSDLKAANLIFGQWFVDFTMVVSRELIFLVTRDPCARELKWGRKKVFWGQASETLFYLVLSPVVIPLLLPIMSTSSSFQGGTPCSRHHSKSLRLWSSIRLVYVAG